MASADGIGDESSLNAWLMGHGREYAAIIAVRSAARVAPLGWMRPAIEFPKRDVTTLAICRALLSTSVWAKTPSQAITNAAVAAYADVRAASLYAAHPDPNPTDPYGYAYLDAATAAKYSIDAATGAFDIYAETLAEEVDPYGHAAAASAAAAVAAKVAAYDPFWVQVHMDAQVLVARDDISKYPLWFDGEPEYFRGAATEFRRRWQADPAFAFWQRWWEGVVSGRQLDWALQEKVALIPDEVWVQGSGAVAEEIARIEREFANQDSDKLDLTRQISALPSGNADDVSEVMRAFVLHRVELPPTFDAVLGFITLEVERLQGRNYRDDDDRSEARRQIGILTMLHQSVEALRALVPEKCEISVTDAEMAERLSRLFVRKFKEWPRANADELVDSTYRAALVGATLVMLPMIGVTTPYALAAGMVLFGGKKMADAVKAAKDALKS